MAAWLNLFLIIGHITAITAAAGIIAVVFAVINIKDFIAFQKGISLTISNTSKVKLFDRMRNLLKSTSWISIILGTVILAICANLYELLCTAGFPMVFTRILTLHNLPVLNYYLYIVLYNIIYVIPLIAIVTIFLAGSKKRNISEWQGRVLKLISGVMMLELGAILLLKPSLLNSVFVSLIMLLAALVISLLGTLYAKRSVKK